MSNIKSRVERLERDTGTGDLPVVILFAKGNETKEQAWARDYPDRSFPSDSERRVMVVMWMDA